MGGATLLHCLDRLGEQLNPAIPATCDKAAGNKHVEREVLGPQNAKQDVSGGWVVHCQVVAAGHMACSFRSSHEEKRERETDRQTDREGETDKQTETDKGKTDRQGR